MSADRPSRPSSGALRHLFAGLGWTCALLAAVTVVVARLAAPASTSGDPAPSGAGTPRTFDGRVSGRGDYQPMAAPSRGVAAPARSWQALAAAARAREVCDRAPTAANLQAFGVAALQAASLDAAVQALEDEIRTLAETAGPAAAPTTP